MDKQELLQKFTEYLDKCDEGIGVPINIEGFYFVMVGNVNMPHVSSNDIPTFTANTIGDWNSENTRIMMLKLMEQAPPFLEEMPRPLRAFIINRCCHMLWIANHDLTQKQRSPVNHSLIISN